MMETSLVHFSRGSGSDVVFGFNNTSTFYGQGIASCSSGVICFTHQGHKDQRGRGSATNACVDSKMSAQESSWTPVPCIEPNVRGSPE